MYSVDRFELDRRLILSLQSKGYLPFPSENYLFLYKIDAQKEKVPFGFMFDISCRELYAIVSYKSHEIAWTNSEKEILRLADEKEITLNEKIIGPTNFSNLSDKRKKILSEVYDGIRKLIFKKQLSKFEIDEPKN